MNISFIGLGKLGLCSAACFAAKGHNVIGVDSNKSLIQQLNGGHCPIDETALPLLLESARPNMRFTMDYAEAVHGSDATLIIVPTPSRAEGEFSNDYVEQVLRQLAPALRDKQGFHIVDVVSTVMPTSCESIFRPLLEELTGKTCGQDFGLVYNPEFIALGSVIHNFLNPDMVLIGTSDSRSGETIRELYASMVESAPDYAIMSLTNAEITKLSLNCFVTMKVSFANELAALCERVAGADVDVVTGAIGSDSRVGGKCLKGGLGFGGPCFPRDNLAFQSFADKQGVDVRLSPAVVGVNRTVVDRLEKIVRGALPPGGVVALLGLSYKAGTHIIEEAQPVMLAERLLAQGYHVRLHDPKALPGLVLSLGTKAEFCDDPYDAMAGANGILLLTDWPQFHELDWLRAERDAGEHPVLVDCWRQLKTRSFSRFTYTAIGLGPK